jgi:hypothetical protein
MASRCGQFSPDFLTYVERIDATAAIVLADRSYLKIIARSCTDVTEEQSEPRGA